MEDYLPTNGNENINENEMEELSEESQMKCPFIEASALEEDNPYTVPFTSSYQ